MITTFTISKDKKTIIIICPECNKHTKIKSDMFGEFAFTEDKCCHIDKDDYKDFTGFIINTERE